jgi:hypothetical protein
MPVNRFGVDTGWISHHALRNDVVLPQNCYSQSIKFGSFLSGEQILEVPTSHNWLIPLIAGQEVEIDEEIWVNGAMIVTLIS